MANPLPNEEEFYARIKNEDINVSLEIWDLLYHRIGDDLTSINLLCQYYLKNSEPIPIQEAKKILLYTRHIKDINNRITFVSSDDSYFPELGDGQPLHPIVREMLTHYIGNDVYMINLKVQDSIDPLEPHPISVELIRKILIHTRSISDFMERLRVATSREESPAGQEEPRKDNKDLTREEVFVKIRRCVALEFGLNEEKIQRGARFREDLELDSIDTIRVIIALEEEFGLELPDDAADGVLTVGQAVDYIYNILHRE